MFTFRLACNNFQILRTYFFLIRIAYLPPYYTTTLHAKFGAFFSSYSWQHCSSTWYPRGPIQLGCEQGKASLCRYVVQTGAPSRSERAHTEGTPEGPDMVTPPPSNDACIFF